MRYKNIKPVVVELQSFRYECGLYDIDSEEDWICKSKNKVKEKDVCLPFECPLAYEASLADLKKYDISLYREYKKVYKSELKSGQTEGDCSPSADYGDGYMIQYRKCTKKYPPTV